MGKPLSKASEGGDFDILGEWEEVTKSDVQHGSGKACAHLSEGSPRSLSDRLTHVRLSGFSATLR